MVLWAIDHTSGFKTGAIISAFLALIIYLGAPFSKAHYNPAVSLAFFIRKEINGKLLTVYLIAEVIGAILAVFAYHIIFEKTLESPSFLTVTLNQLGAEFVGTALLVATILAVATLRKTQGNKYYGIAIALSVWISILLFGKVSGSFINPTVALAGFIDNVISLKTLLAFIPVQIIAGVSIGYLYNYVFKDVSSNR